ncbi:ATP-binding protein [Vulgatibacter sp.]|uniref:sensor histidine kinase n=1 Tax=Vulgatibacter sp. TaxID=1971226 RepID=UPI0035663CC5
MTFPKESGGAALRHAWLRLTVESGALAVTYVLLAIASLHGPRQGLLTAFWPAGGVALAVLVWRGVSRWPGVFVGMLVVAFLWIAGTPHEPDAQPWILGVAMAVMRTAGTVLCAALLVGCDLHRVPGVVRYLVVAGLLYPAITTAGTVASFAVAGFDAVAASLADSIRVFFVPNATGAMVFAAPVLLLVERPRDRVERGRLEALLCAAAVVGTAAFVFRESGSLPLTERPFYLTFLPLLWAAVRFHVRGAALGAVAVATVALAATGGIAAPLDVAQRTIAGLQLYLDMLVVSMLAIGAAVEERHHAARSLEHARQSLAEQVEERTAALRVAHDFTELVVETSGALAALFDREGRLLSANAATEAIFGDMTGLSPADYLPEDSVPIFARALRRVRAGLPFESSDIEMIDRDGRRRQIHWTGTPYRGADGPVDRLLFTGVDFTERVAAAHALRDSLALLRSTLEATADGILVVSREGRILAWNQRFAELWNVPRDVLAAGENAGALRHVRPQLVDWQGFHEQLEALHRHPEEESADVIELRDGRIFERYSKPQRIGGRIAGRVWSFRDATARHVAEAQRDRLLVEERRARLAAEQAFTAAQQAIHVRDEFLSIASHELKTPLTSTKAQLQQMRRLIEKAGVLDERRLRGPLALTHRQLGRIRQLVDELRGISRLTNEPIRLEPVQVDLRALVVAAVARQAEAAARVGVELEVADGPPLAAHVDPARIAQLLGTVISNAIKFGAGQPVDVALASESGRARIAVTDHGIGVDRADAERIFERFERGVDSRHYGGFGLGLWLARRIAESSGGTIAVESRPGAGATFVIELPVAPGAGILPSEELT